MASARIRDPMRQLEEFEPFPAEVEVERRLLENPRIKPHSLLYEGLRLQEIFCGLLPREELNHIHIVFTNRIPCTWKEADGRYHMGVAIYGFPSIISTSGIVEAPAKPKEHCLMRQAYLVAGGRWMTWRKSS